jgi:acyl-CoA reductase-like NAD-dependent aldehyde dehydrogenase
VADPGAAALQPSAVLITNFWNWVGALLQPLLNFLESKKVLGTITKRKPQLPQLPTPQPASSTQECDTLLQHLQGAKQEWVHTSTAERAHILLQCIATLLPMASEIAQAGAAAKGQYEAGYGEEM